MSPAPATSGSFADELYRLLKPLADVDGGDETRAWSFLHYCSAIGVPFQLIVDVVFDQEDGTPGWGVLMDVDRCPTWALPWLAQFRGVHFPPREAGETEADYWLAMRERTKRADGQNRGAADAARAAAERFLTGTKYVVFNERTGGDPYATSVRTLTSETPDPALVLRALLEQKPAGLVLDYATTAAAAPTWDLLIAAFDTWGDVLARYPTWNDAVTEMP